MEHFTVYWYHSCENEEPRTFYVEIGDDRFETRKVQIYDDGSFGMAGHSFSFGGAELGDQPAPPIEEINGDTEFSANIITAEEFETVWVKYQNYLSQ